MEVAKNRVTTINYILRDEQGNVIDRSSDASFQYLHGAGNIIPGLEKALEGKSTGDHVDVVIPPEQAYGLRNTDNVHRIPIDRLPKGEPVKPGMSYRAISENGQGVVVTVTRVGNDSVDIDANHPLAGVSLHFEVDVVNVRIADQEEIKHGHAHTPDGHAAS